MIDTKFLKYVPDKAEVRQKRQNTTLTGLSIQIFAWGGTRSIGCDDFQKISLIFLGIYDTSSVELR